MNVTFERFSRHTGLSLSYIRAKIKRGVWKVGRGAAREKAVLRAVGGATLINCEAFDNWVTSDWRRKASKAAWSKANAGKVTAYTRARQTAKAQRTPPWADLDAIQAIYEEAHRVSRETGIKHHVDHEVPLRGKTVSGLHVPWNLRIVPASVNQKKHNKFSCS